jgi:hypothetical protein
MRTLPNIGLRLLEQQQRSRPPSVGELILPRIRHPLELVTGVIFPNGVSTLLGKIIPVTSSKRKYTMPVRVLFHGTPQTMWHPGYRMSHWP